MYFLLGMPIFRGELLVSGRVTHFFFHCEGKCPGDLLRAVARSEAVRRWLNSEDDGALGTAWISKSPEVIKEEYMGVSKKIQQIVTSNK